jgi:REP-associated tyrosine transposase
VARDGLPQRRSLRLRDYDYASDGAYFITICTHLRSCLFGSVVDGEMDLNAAGQSIHDAWDELANLPGVELDLMVVMPNHLHGIVVLPGTDGDRQGSSRVTLSSVVQRFKSETTVRYIRGVKQDGWPRFSKTLWQRNYYEHVIRDDDDLIRIQEYILTNPLSWYLDRENPDVVSSPTG